MLLEIQKEFIEYLKQTRKRKYQGKAYLERLNEYLSKTGLDMYRLKVKEAQDFQSYVMTVTNEGGSVHYTKRTVGEAATEMRNFYAFLKKRGLVYSNPFMSVRKVKNGRSLPKDIPDEETVNALLARFREFWKGPAPLNRRPLVKRQFYRAHVVCELIYSTGLFITEVAELKPEDVDLKRGLVNCRNNRGNGRVCVLNEYACKVLQIYLEKMRPVLLGDHLHTRGQEYLFGSAGNLQKWLNEVLQREAKQAGLKSFTSKQLRHAMAFHLLRGGCDVRYIQEIVGHKRISNTQIYIEMDKEGLKSVIDRFHPRTISAHDLQANDKAGCGNGTGQAQLKIKEEHHEGH